MMEDTRLNNKKKSKFPAISFSYNLYNVSIGIDVDKAPLS